MKERILQSLQGKAQILEQYDENGFFGIHFTIPGESKWQDGIHGYVLIQGEKVLGKDYSNGYASANNRPMILAQYIQDIKEAQNIK